MTCSLKTKNEKLELGTCGINDPWFYREVRCESGAVTQLYKGASALQSFHKGMLK